VTVVGQAVVRVVPDARGFDQALEEEVERPVSATAGKITALLGGAFALSKAKDFFVDTIGAASDLGEVSSKVSTVFGEASDSVLSFADDAAVSMGQSKNQALEAVGVFGNLLRSLELNETQAADMSTGMVQLASDLASFNNADVQEVTDALRAGLVGETEPLKRFGINLNAARIEAEGMAMGLADASGELDGAAKAQATYALIMKDTTLAQGDFARTSDGLANTQRILTARWEDAKIQIGEGLLPLALQLAQVAGDDLLPAISELAESAVPLIVRAFEVANPLMGGGLTILEAMAPALDAVAAVLEAIPDPVLQLATVAYAANRGISGVTGVVSGLTGSLGGLAKVDWSGNLTGPAKGATSALSGVNMAALGVTAAVAAGVFIYDQATAASREYERTVKELAGELEGVAAGQTEVNDVVGAFLEEQFQDFGAKGVEALNAFDLSFQDLEDAIIGGGDVLDPFRQKVEDLGVDLKGVDFGKLNDTEGTRALEDLAEATGLSGGAIADLVDEIEDYDNAVQESAKAELDRLVATERITAADRDAYIEMSALNTGTENYAAALHQATTNLELLAGGQEESSEGTEDLTTATTELSDAFDATAEPLENLNDLMSDLQDSLIDAHTSTLDLADAEAAMEQAFVEVAEKAKVAADENWKNEDANRDLAQALRDAERDALRQAEAAVQVAEDNAKAAGQTLSWKEKNDILRGELQKVYEKTKAGSPLRDSLGALIWQLATVPGDYTAEVNLRLKDNGVLAAMQYIESVGGGYDVPSGLVTGSTQVYRGAAHGFYGTVQGGSPLLVGEGAGAEDVLVVPQSLGGLDRVIGELAASIAGTGAPVPMIGQLVVPGATLEGAFATAEQVIAEARAEQFRQGASL
jgi:hypothetical protein